MSKTSELKPFFGQNEGLKFSMIFALLLSIRFSCLNLSAGDSLYIKKEVSKVWNSAH